MRPYYEQDGVTIYCGNCLDVLPQLTADVLVTDPPYGVAFEGKATKHTTRRSGGYTTDDDPNVGPVAVQMALALVKRGLVFPGIRGMFLYPRPDDVGGIYCPSGAGIGRWGFVCFHPALFYGKRKSSALYPTMRQSFDITEEHEHPCAKPLPWMLWAIDMVSLPGEVVLDPFMGSGTTLVAAKELRRKAIGIEIEERYCEIAAERLAQRVLPLEETA